MPADRRGGLGLLRHARRLIVLVFGSTVVGLGVAMLVLPGPAVLVIPAGVAILATEFAWARRLLREVKARVGLGSGGTGANGGPPDGRGGPESGAPDGRGGPESGAPDGRGGPKSGAPDGRSGPKSGVADGRSGP